MFANIRKWDFKVAGQANKNGQQVLIISKLTAKN